MAHPELRGAGREGETSAGPAPVPIVALIAICLGYFMTILDTTIVTVALPNLGHELGVTVTGLQWAVDGYALVFASLLLSAGALGDRLGSRQVFLAGLLLFTIASGLCGLAPTIWALVASRVIQGVGAALLVPTSLALLRYTFDDAASRARAVGIWGGIAGLGAAGGPVLGGVLVAAFGWRSVFLVNIPIGILGALLTLRFVVRVPRLPQRGLDLPAQLTAVLALGLLTVAAIQGAAWGWGSPLVLGSLGVAVLATIVFLAIERRSPTPMLPLGLFRTPTFSAGTAVGFLINFGFYGQLFLLSLFFQQVRGFSPLLTGFALLPESGMASVASALSGRLTGRLGPRPSMVLGLALGGAGLLSLALVGTGTAYLILVPMLAAVGFGMAFTMPAATTAVVDAAPAERAGIASGVINASRQLGGVLGVALLGGLVNQHGFFVPGMHVALAIAGGAFLFGCLVTLRAVTSGPSHGDAP